MPLQFFRLVSAEIVRGCGGSQKLRFRAWADAIRGVMRFSANKTKNLSVMQTGLDWSGVVMTQDSHQIPAVCSSILLKSPALFFFLRKCKVLCESFLLYFCFSDLWVRHGAVVQQWLPPPGVRWRGHQRGTYSEISCEWLSPLLWMSFKIKPSA